MADVPYGLRRYQQHEQARIAGRDAEIERLRAALDDAERHADLRQMEVERLQALIDAYAEAVKRGQQWRLVNNTWAKSNENYIAAREALLAAATKEDDRG